MEESRAPFPPTIMVLVDYYLPGFRAGGHIQSIWNLTEALGAKQQFSVITADRDLGADRPYPGIREGAFQPVGRCSVRYLAPRERGSALRSLLRSTPYDVLYLNSFFSPKFTILPLVLRRLRLIPHTQVVVAPRGEFSPSARGLKATKKRAWIAVSRLLGIYRGATWHATSDDESDLIRSVVGDDVRIVVAGEIVSETLAVQSGVEASRPKKRPGEARIVFLSRISRMKNLRSAISMVGAIPEGHLAFDIYGPIDDEVYWQECLRSMNGPAARHVSIRYRGDLPHSEVAEVLSQYDLFLLPTLGENFGYAVIEALAAGCPVAISDRTQWGQIEEVGAGWVVPLDDRRRWEAVIQDVVAADEEGLNARRNAARGLARSRISGREDLDRYRDLFLVDG